MFEKLLKKLKLIQALSFELELSKTEFEKHLQQIACKEQFSISDYFSAKCKFYLKEQTEHGFILQPKRKFFSNESGHLIHFKAKYKVSENQKLMISGEISLAGNLPQGSFISITFFYSLIFFLTVPGSSDLFSIMVTVCLGIVLYLGGYLFFRSILSTNRQIIEKEFKSNPTPPNQQ